MLGSVIALHSCPCAIAAWPSVTTATSEKNNLISVPSLAYRWRVASATSDLLVLSNGSWIVAGQKCTPCCSLTMPQFCEEKTRACALSVELSSEQEAARVRTLPGA